MGFQGRQLPTKGLEGDPVLVSLCRRCMASDPGQRPTFPEILQVSREGRLAEPACEPWWVCCQGPDLGQSPLPAGAALGRCWFQYVCAELAQARNRALVLPSLHHLCAVRNWRYTIRPVPTIAARAASYWTRRGPRLSQKTAPWFSRRCTWQLQRGHNAGARVELRS